MSNIQQIENKNDDKLSIHERKLQFIKQQLSRKPTPQEAKERERYYKQMEELMIDDGDPFSYCFESGFDDDELESSLVITILNGCNLHSEVTKKLNSDIGRFRLGEALIVMEKLLDYLVEEHIAYKKPIPKEHTYIASDYYVFRDNIVFEPTEEFDVRCEKKWALGVIFYYLVTGYPALEGKEQIEFYDKVGLGPKLNTPSRNILNRKSHSFPSKRWASLSKHTRDCIKGLTSFHPGNRTLTDDLCFNLFPDDDSDEDYDDDVQGILESNKKWEQSMDVASFKTIIGVQREDMKQFLEGKTQKNDPEQNRRKSEWSAFFKEARTLSRKKTKKINYAKKKHATEEKENTENKIQYWLKLYNNRYASDDAYEEYNKASVPYGAWGRVG